MTLAVTLEPDQFADVVKQAKQLGISPEELARLLLRNLLSGPSEEFKRIAAEIVAENRELYERLR